VNCSNTVGRNSFARNLGMGGGITHCKKIAAVAESYSSVFLSHNWLGPLLTAAAIHIDVSIPNFVVQEYSVDDETAPENAVFRSSMRREGGYMLIPTPPGSASSPPRDRATFPAVPNRLGSRRRPVPSIDGAVHASF